MTKPKRLIGMFLNKILEKCREQRRPTAAQQREWIELAARSAPPRSFLDALRKTEEPRIIAEFKRASPSKGEIAPGAEPAQVASAYAAAGACAMSVLTEENFFKGSFQDLQAARAQVQIPVLRKDFLQEEWEIHQARAWGADAILLIASVLELSRLGDMLQLTHELKMDALVEVHSQEDLEKALAVQPRIIGINNRDLVTFQVDLENTRRLARDIPQDIVKISESGIYERRQILEFPEVDAFLVGESLMRGGDPGRALRELRGKE